MHAYHLALCRIVCNVSQGQEQEPDDVALPRVKLQMTRGGMETSAVFECSDLKSACVASARVATAYSRHLTLLGLRGCALKKTRPRLQ
jgi:hypothetical protein